MANKRKTKKTKNGSGQHTLIVILLILTIVIAILAYVKIKSVHENKTFSQTASEIIYDIQHASSPEEFFTGQVDAWYDAQYLAGRDVIGERRGMTGLHEKTGGVSADEAGESAEVSGASSAEASGASSGTQNVSVAFTGDADFSGGNDSYKTSSIEIPLCPATKSGENGGDHEVHEYLGFTLCYRESYENPEWVAYTLTKEELNAVTGRTEDFRSDTNISTGSATLKDYRGSGYDRGHMAPAADMEWSHESASESFLLSNMSPQAPQLNRGLWKDLESQVRTWAKKFGEVTVVTGPVLEHDASAYSAIGENKVSVPEYYYKVLLAQSKNGKIATAFILPNRKCEGTIWDYCVSVDEVEERTGLDFFSMLSDSEEEKLESEIKTDGWK